MRLRERVHSFSFLLKAHRLVVFNIDFLLWEWRRVLHQSSSAKLCLNTEKILNKNVLDIIYVGIEASVS